MTGHTSARLLARASPFLALLIVLLFLPHGAAAYNVPLRDDYYEWCYWWELQGAPGGAIGYDASDNNPWWTAGVENWDSALGSLMHFEWQVYPSGQTHLRWEGEPPSYEYCADWAYACFKVEECTGSQMNRATIYFDYDNYLGAIEADRIATCAHEWGHNLNLGDYDPPRYFCERPYRIMGWPDGVGCITGPSCPEQAAVIDYYMLIPWWHDRDGDCFDNDVEDYLPTDDWDDCPDNAWDDAWPLDMDMNTLINLGGDAAKYVGKIGCYVPTNPECRRLDLDANGLINLVGDVSKYVGRIGDICTNP